MDRYNMIWRIFLQTTFFISCQAAGKKMMPAGTFPAGSYITPPVGSYITPLSSASFVSPSPGSIVKCGKEYIDKDHFVCCNDIPHAKAWEEDTGCCGQNAYNPKVESCCNGMLGPAYGIDNHDGGCCGKQSFDTRCYSCSKRGKVVVPTFDFRHQACCDGKIQELLPNKTCCCGTKVFDPERFYCCEGVITKRPIDIPGDCCDCGLTLVDIVIVLDSSESIDRDRSQKNWRKMLAFVQDILVEADIDNDRTRVGVLTYRHNVTRDIYLDSFHNKQKLFRRVKRIKYVPGSTNTGAALEEMRTIMFNPHHGDRLNVKDVCIVITDGESDDPKYTIEQARLAKEAGIHIFAIGIDLKNDTELKLMASPPASKNVLEIDNFDHLADLRGKIFSSICTGIPIITIYEPCGDDFYNPRDQICCDGKPQDRVGGKETLCCGQKSYNMQKEICCDKLVSNRKAGSKTLCCGKFAQHPEQELCCDSRPVPRATAAFSKCCDIYAYNPKTEVCCEGYVTRGYGNIEIDTGCCDEMSYDKRCYDCIDGKLVPIFDPECQICCDGVIHNMTIGYSCCCGQELFRPDKLICCNGRLRDRKPSESSLCCECGNALVDIGIVLDSSESIRSQNWELLKKFLVDVIEDSDLDTGNTRIGLLSYRHNVSLNFYLHTFLRKANMIQYVKNMTYIPGSTNTGMALEVMRNSLFVTRNGDRIGVPNIAVVITDGHSDDPAYTKEQARLAKEEGIHIYVVGVGLEKTQELHDIASPPANDNIFTSKTFEDLDNLEAKLFSVFTDNCPQEPKQKLKKPCGKKMYDPLQEVCCDGNPQPKYGSDENTECCGKKSYNYRQQMCCKGKVVQKPHPTRSLCCEADSYDPKEAICCYNATVIPKSDPGSTDCCGLETYNPEEDLCCDDMLFPNYGPKGCCGSCCLLKGGKLVSFDTRCYVCEDGELVPLYDCAFQRCCDGVIQNITSDMTCCCGKQAFDPSDLVCCERKLRKRTPQDDRACCECSRNFVDVVFILDSSESVGIENWILMEEFVENLINDSVVPQIRFALISFRHTVRIHFNLNSYFKKEDLLAAVDSLPYDKGSTNTGEAIEVMRKKIFTKAAGDRSFAPDICILITDGLSDNPKYTLEQAELAKRKGIHIMALGLGLTKLGLKELIGIASEPKEENAISLENFKELQKVEDKIYNEMSETVCPQEPKPRCRVPCGEYFIDENMEICCLENPGPKMAGDRTKCCDTVAYDPDCFLCCEGYLVSRYAKQFTACCCRQAYDTRVQVCCGNQILPKVAPGDVTGCCHNKSYDIRSEICCEYLNVRPSYGLNRTGCCGSKSYDMYCEECKDDKKIVPIYDKSTQLCCDGDIQDKQFEDRSCCCGKEQFDVDLSICCEENIIERPPEEEVICCGPKIYNPKNKICCDGRVNPRMNGYETLCCGRKSFHPDYGYCCDGNLNNRTSKDENCCCDKTVFDVNTQICCEGSVYPLFEDRVRKSTICCANVAFDPKTHLCCDRTVQPLTNGTSTVCCGKTAYNTDTHVCEYGKVRKIMGTCQGKKYNLDTQICCNGWVNKVRRGAESNTRCCFDKAYDIRKNVCCCNGFLQPAFAGNYTQCCYSYGYDARKFICCDGQVVEKKVPSADCCCLRESYDSKREICCGGKVKSRCVGLFTKCCGTEAYDPGYMICCGGKLYNRIYGHDTYCCGDEIYTPLLAACCGDKIAYRRKLKIEW